MSEKKGAQVAALVCAVVAAALFQFFGNANHGYIDTGSLFYWWGYQWFNPDSETEHGVLILGIAGWLFWRSLKDDSHGSNEGQRGAALAAMLMALGLHAAGFVAQQARISIVALLLFSWGGLTLAGGRRWGRAAAFPLAFMLFAVPVNVLDSVGFWLRLWVIEATAGLAHLAGFAVVRNGTQLFAPDGSYQYDVAAACSGVRSLMALAALTLLIGYLNFRGWGRRIGVWALCLPLTYLGNVVRIAAVVFAGQWWGQRAGERVHEWAGFTVFLVVLGGVLLAVEAMRRWWPERSEIEDGKSEFGYRSAGRKEIKCHVLRDTRVWRVAALVVVVAGAEMVFLGWLAGLPPRGGVGVQLAVDGKNPVELPTFIGTEWIGRSAEVTAVERAILPADTGYARKNYVAVGDAKQRVFVSVVLSGRDRTSIHRPELCLVGQGWSIESGTQEHFNYPARPDAGFAATVLRVRREVITARGRVAVPELVAYWFVDAERVVATNSGRFWRDAWNRLAHGRPDRWAYVLVQTSATDGEAAALARMQAVLTGTLPAFQRPLPAW
jgi:EpsI family protein